MPRLFINQISGLLPAFDRKRIQKPFVVDGKNFIMSSDGPLSGFAKDEIISNAINDPTFVQSFRVGDTTFVFTQTAVLQFDTATNTFIPLLDYPALTTAFPWSHAIVGGFHYFVRSGVNLLRYNPTTGIWSSLSGGSFPTNPVSCAESAGRLIILNDTSISWSAIDDGSDFVFSTSTGAGSQLLAILGQGAPQQVSQTFDGFLTFTESGILKSEAVIGANPFRHFVLSRSHIAINPYAIVDVGRREHVLLTRTGLYKTSGKVPVLWQELMSEFFHSQVLSSLDPTNQSVIRLAYNIDRQWFVISIAEFENSNIYNKAFVLYEPSNEWGTFNQNHSAFFDVHFATGPVLGFNFGFIAPDGKMYRFTDESFDLHFPALTWNFYNHLGKPQYPAVFQDSVTTFPSVMYLRHVDESIYPEIGIFDDVAVLESGVNPQSLQVLTEATNTDGTAFFTDTLQDADTTLLENHLVNGANLWENISTNDSVLDTTFGLDFVSNRLTPFFGTFGGFYQISYRYIPRLSLTDKQVDFTLDFANGVDVKSFALIYVFALDSAPLSISETLRVAWDPNNHAFSLVHFHSFAPGGIAFNEATPNNSHPPIAGAYTCKLIVHKRDLELWVNGVLVISGTSTEDTYGTAVGPHDRLLYEANFGGSSALVGVDDPRLSNIVVSDIGQTIFESKFQMQEELLHLHTGLVQKETSTLDAFVDIGLFSITDQQEANEASMMTELTVGSLNAASKEESVDWLNDFSNDIVEDWALASGSEDWGLKTKFPTDYDLTVQATNDGYKTWQTNQFMPTIIENDGRSRFYDVFNTGIFHIIKVNAQQADKAFHIKTLEVELQPAGFV